ncbi:MULTISPECIES: tyrosine-type recombinase/integrase [unclassified Frankia]|uniref:tyrosine-type recombinase/integrase n=1 Tax=unclassified Frankia TaxID=2632575 RepID=UPI0027DD87C7|nr:MULTISPECIES: tyrosine-type recombinase/integrase [unclassified Frankia]
MTVTGCVKRRGAGAILSLSGPLPVAMPRGTELGRDLLSRRRLHDLRHSSASIQLAEGIDITLVSKRLGHSSPHITGLRYTHLLRSAGQAAAEKVANAVPRRVVRRHAHLTPTTINEGDEGQSAEVNLQVSSLDTGGPSGTRTLNSPVKRGREDPVGTGDGKRKRIRCSGSRHGYDRVRVIENGVGWARRAQRVPITSPATLSMTPLAGSYAA